MLHSITLFAKRNNTKATIILSGKRSQAWVFGYFDGFVFGIVESEDKWFGFDLYVLGGCLRFVWV